MASMMDEMAKTLARRRAQAEKKPEVIIISVLIVELILFVFEKKLYVLTVRYVVNSWTLIMINLDHGKSPIHYHIN